MGSSELGLVHLAQATLIVVVLACCERARRRVQRLARFDERLDDTLGADPTLAPFVAEQAAGSVAGELAAAVVEAEDEGADVGLALDFAHRGITRRLTSELRTLRVLGRVSASAGGLVAVGFYLRIHLFPRGLDGLIPGLLERRASEEATYAIALGLGAALLTLVARLALAPVGRETLARSRRLKLRLESGLDKLAGVSLDSPQRDDEGKGEMAEE